jgi:hypothetical protein
MKRPEIARSEWVLTLSTRESIETGTRFADLVIGGLLVLFVIGGFAL